MVLLTKVNNDYIINGDKGIGGGDIDYSSLHSFLYSSLSMVACVGSVKILFQI